MNSSTDFAEMVENEIVEQQAANARGYDREAALLELQALIFDAFARSTTGHVVTFEDVADAASTPEQRAKFRSLLDRIAPPHEQEVNDEQEQ